MAKDVLAISVAEVGYERSFSSERDIDNYRRGRLLGAIIEDIMIVKHYKCQQNPSIQKLERLNEESQMPPPQSMDEKSEEKDNNLI